MKNVTVLHNLITPASQNTGLNGCCAGDNITDSTAGFHLGQHIVADPMFVDPMAMDFRLRPGSPAIGAATDGGNLGACGVKTDFVKTDDDAPVQLDLSGVAVRAAPHNCTCKEQRFCNPLTTPVLRSREVFPFLGAASGESNLSTQFQHMPWPLVTTLAWGPTDELLCEAHRRNIRVVSAGGGIGPADLANASARSRWATGILQSVKAAGHDGVNFDVRAHLVWLALPLSPDQTDVVRSKVTLRWRTR